MQHYPCKCIYMQSIYSHVQLLAISSKHIKQIVYYKYHKIKDENEKKHNIEFILI